MKLQASLEKEGKISVVRTMEAAMQKLQKQTLNPYIKEFWKYIFFFIHLSIRTVEITVIYPLLNF